MRIFLSYRRADLGGHAQALVGRVFDRLASQYGDENVTLDVGSIPPGQDFADFIRQRIMSSDVVLAFIGPEWLGELHARKDASDDFVRFEIQAALERKVSLIPVLIGNAQMPGGEDLPETLRSLSKLNAIDIDSGSDFGLHISRLMETLNSLKKTEVISSGRFEALRESDNDGNIARYVLLESGACLSYRSVIDKLESDPDFVEFFCQLFRECGFLAYVWETPPIHAGSVDRDFEFILMNQPTPSGAPDRQTYAEYFDANSSDRGIVNFLNLGKDALLVVPSPLDPGCNYRDLPSFFANAPCAQQHALWMVVARSIRESPRDDPIWVSVAGGGVSWLHVRLDTYPKYYRHTPYRAGP